MKLVPRATSIEGRFRSIKQLRPRFKLPDKINAIWWPKSVQSLVEHDVWDAIVQRIADGGFVETVRGCAEVLDELRRLERHEVHNAIPAKESQALWEK